MFFKKIKKELKTQDEINKVIKSTLEILQKTTSNISNVLDTHKGFMETQLKVNKKLLELIKKQGMS